MPLYDFQCSEGHKFELMVPLKDFEAPVFCACTLPAKRLISRPMFVVEDVGYNCPITDRWIGSKREHARNLAEHGCRVLETGERESFAARKQAEEDRFDKAIEDTVEKAIEEMPSAKKEQLSNELLNGKLDLSYERGTAP